MYLLILFGASIIYLELARRSLVEAKFDRVGRSNDLATKSIHFHAATKLSEKND